MISDMFKDLEFNEILCQSFKENATHICKECDTWVVQGYGLKGTKEVCEKCGKTMTRTNKPLFGEIKKMISYWR